MEEIDSKARSWFEAGVRQLTSHPPELVSAIASFSRALFLAPTSAVLFHHRGEAYFRLCDFQSAILNFRKAHALAPRDYSIRARLAQLHYIQGRLHLDNGDIESAVRGFSDAITLQPHNTDFWIFRIKSWIRGKSYGKALNELNRFITHPGSEEYFAPAAPAAAAASQRSSAASAEQQHHHQQQQQQAQQQHPHQRTDSGHNVHVDPASPSHLEQGGSQHQQAENFHLNLEAAQAVAVSNEGEGEGADAAHEVVNALLTARGRATQLSLWRTVQALILRAKLHIILERNDLALRDIGWAHNLAPNNAEVKAVLESLSQKAEFLYGNATAYLLANEKQHAIEELTKALELNPHQIKFYNMRATLYREQKLYDEALKDLKMALNISVALREAMRQRRKEEKKLQQQQEQQQQQPPRSQQRGRDETTDASSISASDLDGTDAGGASTFVTQMDDEEDGEAELPKDAQALELENSLALTFNGLGVQYFQSGQFSHGISCLSKAIELVPTNATFYLNRGDCFFAENECNSALGDYQKAKEIQPANMAIGSKIANIHLKIGRELFNRVDYEAAEAELSRAIVADPFSSSSYFLRARTNFLLKRYERSYLDCERALELNPSDHEARRFLLQLRSTLLRPEDVRRAGDLPPIPAKDVAWNPVGGATAAGSPARRQGGVSSSSNPRGSQNRPQMYQQGRQGYGYGSSASSEPGSSILQLVYGDQPQGISFIPTSKNVRAGNRRR